jgi:periplasmic copper chaperone A
MSMGSMSTQEASATAMGNMSSMDMGPATSAAYMVIKNSGSEPDALMSAQSDVAKAIELHNVKMQNDVMTMFQVPQIDIPASGQVELKSGSYHIMLIGLTRDLKSGDKVTLTLNFQKSGAMTVEADVRDQ